MSKTVNLNITCTIPLNEKNQKTSENKFDSLIIEAIEESLSSFESFDKQEVYFYLENTFKIRKWEIPRKIEHFTDAIEQLLGIGAKLVEVRIIKAIHKRIPEFVFAPKTGAIIFKDYITSLRAFLLQSS